MKTAEYWNLFYESGRINDYLQYACTSEESQLKNSVQEVIEDDGKSDWDGTLSIPY